MNEKKFYNSLGDELRKKFGERVLKICIDGGFTCPNRDGTKGYGGCAFCGERGSGDNTNEHLSIEKQIETHLNSYRGKRANKFVAYFQNFTNTYDNIENLKTKYDKAISNKKIVALAIATRPDCIDENVAKLLHYYSKKVYIWVELGLQTINERSVDNLNIKYTKEEFTETVKLLNKYNIDVVTHIMIGLPNENHNDIENITSFINTHNIWGLKIHSTYVLKNTQLEKEYLQGKYIPISSMDYINEVIYILTHINPNMVIHRLTGDAPKKLLIAPEWNLHKKRILLDIEHVMSEKRYKQGIYYNSTNI